MWRRVDRNKWSWYNRRRMAILRLGGRCKRCGFDDMRALELDHIVPQRSGHNDVARRTGSKKLATQRYRNSIKEAMNQDLNSPTIQCLCSNCHSIKTYKETHPCGTGKYWTNYSRLHRRKARPATQSGRKHQHNR